MSNTAATLFWGALFGLGLCFVLVALVRHGMSQALQHPDEPEDAKLAEKPYLPLPMVKHKSFQDRLEMRRKRKALMTPHEREEDEFRRMRRWQ